MSHRPTRSVLPSAPRHSEARRRFAFLRSLITDHKRRHRLILIGMLLALLAVAVLSALARIYTVLPIDVWFTQELQSEPWALFTRLMVAVSWVGYAPWSAVSVAIGTLLVGVLLGWRDGMFLLLVTLAQGLVNALIKRSIGRPRPIDTLVDVFTPASGFSFPSGHVMFYTVFFGLLLFLVLTRGPTAWFRWLLGIPLAALVLLVGPSRIILGVHWLSDVIAAYLLGLAILVLAIEGYIHFLAPSTPAAEHGLIRQYDQRREANPPPES